MIEQVKKYLVHLQESICSDLESLDGGAIFEKDHWIKKDGNGSGITSVICDVNVFEKGGVNFSIVEGNKMPKSATTLRPDLEGRKYTASFFGYSIQRIRTYPLCKRTFFCCPGKEIWWFGGGFDSPFYGFDEDAVHWHIVFLLVKKSIHNTKNGVMTISI